MGPANGKLKEKAVFLLYCGDETAASHAGPKEKRKESVLKITIILTEKTAGYRLDSNQREKFVCRIRYADMCAFLSSGAGASCCC